MSNEKSVLVLGPVFGIFPTVAEVLDSPEGPENKIFRFRDAECPEYRNRGEWSERWHRVKSINVYSYWPPPNSLDEPGEREGEYRVCRRLETPPGYIAVLEGTTKPKAEPAASAPVDPEAGKCEQAIIDAMAAEPRMSLYALKRKTHAERFGLDLWEKCIKALTDTGEIRLETERGLTSRERTWVIRCDEAVSAPELESSAPASAPRIDTVFGAGIRVENEGS
jgi:hypothetical protein